jgi:hypothetical protein
MEKQQYVFFSIIELHVAVNNIKVLSVATEVQQGVLYALFSSYKIFRTAVNNQHILRSVLKFPDIFVRF